MTHPDFAQLAEQEELTDPQANSDDLPELEESADWFTSTMDTINKNSEIYMAMEARIEHLQDINDYLIRDGSNNSSILTSIARCKQVITDIHA